MQRFSTKAIVEGALLSAITVILSFFSMYIPGLGLFIDLVLPVPIILLGMKHGLKISLLSVAVTGLVIAAFSGPLRALTAVLSFGLVGMGMGWALKKNYSPFKVFGVGAAASLVSNVVLFLLSLMIMGINPLMQEIELYRESLAGAAKLYNRMGVNPETIKPVLEMYEKMLDLMPLLIPAVLVLASLTSSFLCFQISKLILRRLGYNMEDFPPFWQWRLPTYTIFLFLLGQIAIIMEAYWPSGILRQLGMNLLLIFAFAFFIQGFAVLAFFLGRYNVSKLLRIFIVLFLFSNPFMAQLVFLLGMFDTVFNFRGL
ncbi:MAG: YybS family protein [Thermosediminibacteraceae bacterium]|nr:YybS family protein [Thermosediminibacteraceae bacterium]